MMQRCHIAITEACGIALWRLIVSVNKSFYFAMSDVTLQLICSLI